jgi:glutaredoxin
VPYTVEVHAGKVVKMITLTPIPGQAWSYNSKVSYKQTLKAPFEQEVNVPEQTGRSVIADPEERISEIGEVRARQKSQIQKLADEIVSREGITLLMQPGCGRTMKVTESFDLYKVPYEFVPLKTQAEFGELVQAIGTASGLAPRSARSPVIVENGKPLYDIDDLGAYIKGKQIQYGATPEINKDPGLVLYTKAGCGRCAFAKSYLKEQGVKYIEVDLEKASKETTAMWDRLRAQGTTGTRVQTPVIEHAEKLYHEIPDLQKFLQGLVLR